MSLRTMLRTVATLQRATITKDASGGAAYDYEDSTTGIRCDVQPASGTTRLQYSQLQLIVTHSVYIDRDIGAMKKDRLQIGDRYFLIEGYRRAPPGMPGYHSWPAICDVSEQPGS